MGSNPSARVPGRILPFLIAFVVGTAAMVLLRMMLPDPPWIGALCAALAACAAIVVLGAWYYRSDSPRELDRTGDNLYYLGFLFTLISLIHALINLFLFEESGADLAERTYTLIGSLGIALMSTVAGILGRIILHDKSEDRTFPDDPPHPRPDPDEAPAGGRPAEGIASRQGNEGRNVPYGIPERGYLRNDAVFGGTEAGLHLLVRRLRAEIRDATGAFSHFNRMTMLQAEDTKRHAERMVREFSTKLETDARDTVTRTGDTYRNLVGQAHTAGDAFEDRIGKAVGAFTTVLEQLSAASHALSELPANVEQVRRSMDVLDEAAKAVTSRLDDETSEIKEACEILARTAREQRTIMAQSIEFAGTLSTLTEQLGAATRAFAEIPGNMERTRTGVDSLSEAMNTVVTGLDGKTGELARASDSLARSAREQRAIIEQNKEIASSFTSFTGQLGSANQSLVSLATQIERARQVMDDFGTAADDSKGPLHDKVREAADACEALVAGAHAQQQIMARLLEGARTVERRMDSEEIERIRSFEEFRTAFQLVTQTAGALAGLVEQLESTTHSLATSSANVKRIDPARLLSADVKRVAPDGPVSDDGAGTSATNPRDESAGASSRRIGERIPWFRKKT